MQKRVLRCAKAQNSQRIRGLIMAFAVRKQNLWILRTCIQNV